MKLYLTLLISTIAVLTCKTSDKSKEENGIVDSIGNKNNVSLKVDCDPSQVDTPKIKDYKSVYKVFLKENSLDWILENRQSIWKEAKAWHKTTFPISSNSVIKCLSQTKPKIFLYIPNHFYQKEKNGNEYFRFYIVNNSSDTIQVPRLDSVINNIDSSISTNNGTNWLPYQKSGGFVMCGNSVWTMKLPPKTAILSELDSYLLNVGDTSVDYRLEFNFGNEKVVSNSIKINVMKEQLPYLRGNSITEKASR